MKSMLQEGSSISKAIEKAWDNSGRPHEFTIKILEMGDKSLWGITRKPSVISITYDPRKQTQSAKPQEVARDLERKKQVIKPREVIQNKPEGKKIGLLQSLFGKKEDTRKPFTQPIPKKENRRFSERSRDEREGWNDELIDDATSWLKDMFKIMSVQANFSIKAEQKLLTINLDKRVLREAEAEKLFFISLSHLSMQFLKKKHRKKFKNYYLIIHSKLTENNAAKKPENTSK